MVTIDKTSTGSSKYIYLHALYQLRKKYKSWWNLVNKRKTHTHLGLCTALCSVTDNDLDSPLFLNWERRTILMAILFEEGQKFGASKFGSAYWWEKGEITPRLNTINAAIKRIENS